MRIGKIGLLVLAALATPAVAAERSGFYVGGDVGQSNWNITDDDANNFAYAISDGIESFAPVTVTADSGELSDTDTTYSLFIGYQLVPWLAVEASWMELGNSNVKARGAYTYNVNPNIFPPPPDGGTYRTAPCSSRAAAGPCRCSPCCRSGTPGTSLGASAITWATTRSVEFSAQDTLDGVPVGSPTRAELRRVG